MTDVSGVDNLNSNSNGTTSLTGIKSAIDNLNAGKAEISGQVFTGNISAPNLSGTNTGDQTISDATISTSDITTNNSSITKHGFLKKLSNLATDFMNGQGSWASVKDSDLAITDITTNNVSSTAHGFTPKTPNDATKFLRGDGTWAVPGSASWKPLITTRGGQATSGTQTIAHGLGLTPKFLEVEAVYMVSANGFGAFGFSHGAYNGTTQGCVSGMEVSGAAGTAGGAGNSSSAVISLSETFSGTPLSQVAVASWDATNITLTWTATNGGLATTDNINILIKVSA